MDPKEVADTIEDEDSGHQACPHCKNPYAMSAGGKTVCPNDKCDLYDKEYYEALQAVLLPRGVENYNDLVEWINLYVPQEQLEYDAADAVAAAICHRHCTE